MPVSNVNGISRKVGRPFPWICPKCHEKEVRLANITYHGERFFEGRLVSVEIPALEVPKCRQCGEVVFNYAADEQILAAFKKQAVTS
jgi:predicted nucleic-acid-binding Zn-ribbon protein